MSTEANNQLGLDPNFDGYSLNNNQGNYAMNMAQMQGLPPQGYSVQHQGMAMSGAPPMMHSGMNIGGIPVQGMMTQQSGNQMMGSMQSMAPGSLMMSNPGMMSSQGYSQGAQNSSSGSQANMSLPQSGQPPVKIMKRNWHSVDHTQIRAGMVERIITLLKQRRPNAEEKWHEKLPFMAKRLEEALYGQAEQFNEYADANTLKVRLQQLAISMGGKQAPKPNTSDSQMRSSSMPGAPIQASGSNNSLGVAAMPSGQNQQLTKQQQQAYLQQQQQQQQQQMIHLRQLNSNIQSNGPQYGQMMQSQPQQTFVQHPNGLMNMQGPMANHNGAYIPSGSSQSSVMGQNVYNSHQQMQDSNNLGIAFGANSLDVMDNRNLMQQQFFMPQMNSNQGGLPGQKSTSSNQINQMSNMSTDMQSRGGQISAPIHSMAMGPQQGGFQSQGLQNSVNSSEEHRRQVLKQQQQRLLLLRHASKCPHEAGRCPVTPHCANMKALWKHIMSCKDQECKVPHCVSSRYVLSHYSKCKDQGCPVCAPVREAIRKNYERSKEIIHSGNAVTAGNSIAAQGMGSSNSSSFHMVPNSGMSQGNGNLSFMTGPSSTLPAAGSAVNQSAGMVTSSLPPSAPGTAAPAGKAEGVTPKPRAKSKTKKEREKEKEAKEAKEAEEKREREAAATGSYNSSDKISDPAPLTLSVRVPPQSSQIASGTNMSLTLSLSNHHSSAQDQQRSMMPIPNHQPSAIVAHTKPKDIFPLDPISCAIYSFSSEHIVAHFKTIHEGVRLSAARLKEIFLPILDEILRMPNAANVFGFPVDPVALNLPDYTDIVKWPMDLGTVKKRLETSSYRDALNLVNDVHLTFDNAMLYNPKNSPVSLLAKSLKKEFDNRYKHAMHEIEKTLEKMRQNMDACLVCGEVRLLYEPPVYYCNGRCGGQRIRRNAIYYSIGNNAYHWCSPCFNDLKDHNPVRLPDCTVTKAEIAVNKKKHSEDSEEPWVQCDKCERWVHWVCGLFNGRRNTGEDCKFVCPHCLNGERERRRKAELLEPVIAPTMKKMRAFDLPHCNLSQFLETRVAERLEIAYQELALKRDVPIEEIAKCPPIFLRQVSCYDKNQVVREGVAERYKSKNYPADFPCRTKCLVLFQNIDGQDVILFGMYVYEYGDKCPPPNQRRVYVSYLDSVHYFRPKEYRTIVYHEILVSYLEYVKVRGFHTAHIWACPPQKGDDYILYVHPPDQKTPRADKLKNWYQDMLNVCKDRGIVSEVVDIHTEYLADHSNDATCLPYFEGDYWVNEAEVIIKDLGGNDISPTPTAAATATATTTAVPDGDDQDVTDAGSKSKRKLKRPTRSSKMPLISGNKSERDPLMAKLASIIEPMKETFFVARLLHDESLAAKAMCCGGSKAALASQAIISEEDKKIEPLSFMVSTDDSASDIPATTNDEANEQNEIGDLRPDPVDAAFEMAEIAPFVPSDSTVNMEVQPDIAPSIATDAEIEAEDATARTPSSRLKKRKAEDALANDGNSLLPKSLASEGETFECNSSKEGGAIGDENSDFQAVVDAFNQEEQDCGKVEMGGEFSQIDGEGIESNGDIQESLLQVDQEEPSAMGSDAVAIDPETVTSENIIKEEYSEPAQDSNSASLPEDASQLQVPEVTGDSTSISEMVVAADSAENGDAEVKIEIKSEIKSEINDESGALVVASQSSMDVSTMSGNLYEGRFCKVPIDSTDTEDVDDTQESEHFDTRQSFLNLCQGNHYQFDQLRRAKYTSMMVLYHIHNPDAPKFVPSCNLCHKDILQGYRHRCENCDYDFCQSCVEAVGQRIHPHPLRPISMANNGQPPVLTEEQRKERQRSIALHMQLLQHAANCNKECQSRNCAKMKDFLRHDQSCTVKVKGGCRLCSRIQNLLGLHARNCRQDNCRVPRCQEIRDAMKHSAMLQQQMDDRRRTMMNDMYRQGGAAQPLNYDD